MKNVMIRAWEIAREGSARYGGSVKSYFAAALKRAWTEAKSGKVTVSWELPADRRGVKTWMAAIVGTHVKFGLDRKFVTEQDTDRFGDKIFLLSDGIYESFNGKTRAFFEIQNGTYRMIERGEALAAVA